MESMSDNKVSGIEIVLRSLNPALVGHWSVAKGYAESAAVQFTMSNIRPFFNIGFAESVPFTMSNIG